jgi:hypothetical protein
MNMIGDSDDNPEGLPPGMPLSAPVAADMVLERAPTVRFHEHERYPRPSAAYPPPPLAPRQSVAFSPVVSPPAVPDRPVAPGGYVEPEPPEQPPAQPKTSDLAADAAHPPSAAPAMDRQAPYPPAPAPPPPAPGTEPPPTAPAQPDEPEFAQTSPVHADFHPRGGTAKENPPEDPQRVLLRKQLDALRARAGSASSWLDKSAHYAQLVNRDGIVPIAARFTRDDIEFLGRAREEVLSLADLGLRLLELHAPLDAGGISTDPSSPILRCRSCMWRWPCPTFRMLSDALGQMPHPGSPAGR